MHTGIVVEVTASQIVTVEGNSSDQVKKNTYSRSSSYIAGYGHPKYTETAPAASAASDHYGGELTVKVHLLKSGSAGAEVKTIQRICFARGCLDNVGKQITVDGDFGPATKQAVIKLQRQLFPNAPAKWDGEVGSETWTAALTKLW